MDDETIKEKVKFFFENNIQIHFKLKNKRFLNGTVVEQKSEDVLVIAERKFGLMHLFLKDVEEVDEYLEEISR